MNAPSTNQNAQRASPNWQSFLHDVGKDLPHGRVLRDIKPTQCCDHSVSGFDPNDPATWRRRSDVPADRPSNKRKPEEGLKSLGSGRLDCSYGPSRGTKGKRASELASNFMLGDTVDHAETVTLCAQREALAAAKKEGKRPLSSMVRVHALSSAGGGVRLSFFFFFFLFVLLM